MAMKWSGAFLEVGQGPSMSRTSGDIRHPLGTSEFFRRLLPRIQALKPDILCISKFRGATSRIVLKQATDFGVERRPRRIIAPAALPMRAGFAAGPQAFEGGDSADARSIGASKKKFALHQGVQWTPSARCMTGNCRPTMGALGYMAGGSHGAYRGEEPPAASKPTRVIAAMEALKYDFYKGPQ